MAAPWECPALPMIHLPLKESSRANFQPLKPLIGSCYGENPESFSEEIKLLEQLRESSLKPARDYQGCNTMRRYYAQLHLLSARFPEDSNGKIQTHFSWKDAFTNNDYKQEGLQLEMSSLLYNIGALHSQVGSKDGRHSEQDMKESLTHFQYAAGAYQYFYDNHSSNGCGDMSPQLIEMYKNLMLAQAQECTVEKSLKGLSRIKNLNISKIAMKVAQYYQTVLTVMESGSGGTILKKHKDWIKFLQIKSTLYTAIAHLYQANALEEQGNYGYMIAFQQLSLQKIQSVGKLSRGIPDVYKEAIKNFTEYISQKLDTSLSQNEQVFHELVPGLETLEPAPGVELVKPIIFQAVDRRTVGSDIFSRLVPMSAYEASSVYSEEKAKILRSITSSIEEKDVELERFVSSLNMEEIDHAKAEDPTLPAELLTQHQFLQSKRQNIENIQMKVKELKSLSEKVQKQLDSIAQRRLEENEEEKSHKEKHGPRPESQVCTSMWKELQSLTKYHEQASNSNNELFNAFEKHRANLLLLASHKNTLMSAIPRMSLENVSKDFSEERWKELMDKVEEMRQQRVTLTQQLRDQIGEDDITRVIIGELSTNRDALFDEYLQKHRAIADIIRQNLSAQDNILRALTEANASQAQLRQAYHQMMKRREEWCVKLAKSAGCYGFLENKITEGLEFYSKLAESVFRLYKRCQEVCSTRRRDRLALERKLNPDRRTPSPPPSTGVTRPDHTHPLPTNVKSEIIPSEEEVVPLKGEVIPSEGGDGVQEMITKMKQLQEEQKASLGATPTNNDSTVTDNSQSNVTPPIKTDSISTPDSVPTSIPSIDSPVPPMDDSQMLVPDSHIPVPSVQIPVNDSHIPVPNSRIPVPSDQVPVPDNHIPVPTNDNDIGQIPETSHTSSITPPTRPDKPQHLMGVPTASLANISQGNEGLPIDSTDVAGSDDTVTRHITMVTNTAMPTESVPTDPDMSSENSGLQDWTATSSDPNASMASDNVGSIENMSDNASILSNGSTGNTLSDGPPGSMGNALSNGPPGSMHSSGSMGNILSSGPPGSMGNILSSDPPGSMGNALSNGPPGSMHSSGPPGSMGNILSSGPPGSMGNILSSDPPGSMGNALSDGPPDSMHSSDPGSMGNILSSDPPGSTLSNGPPGSMHSSGPPGSMGNILSSDPPGSMGNALSNGPPGSMHSSGPPGNMAGNILSSDPPGSMGSTLTNSDTTLPSTVTDSTVHPMLLTSSIGFAPPPPLSVTTMDMNTPSMSVVQPNTILHLEKMVTNQQQLIQNQTTQLTDQQEQLKTQTMIIEGLRSELHLFRTQQSQQNKDKTASSTNQTMLMKLLQQQQGLFTQQQSQLDKMNKEGEARRQQTTELEMTLRDALAQEQFQNQNLQSQLNQQGKEMQHLHQQLHTVSQQLQGLQSQAQQYLLQIQERDKALSNYRDEHKRIVDGMESQYKQRIQQLTQQLQELQTRVPPPSRGGHPSGLQLPLQPHPHPLSPQQIPPASSSPHNGLGMSSDNRKNGGLMDLPNTPAGEGNHTAVLDPNNISSNPLFHLPNTASVTTPTSVATTGQNPIMFQHGSPHSDSRVPHSHTAGIPISGSYMASQTHPPGSSILPPGKVHVSGPALIPGGTGPALIPGGTGPALIPGGTGPALIPGGTGPALIPGGTRPNTNYIPPGHGSSSAGVRPNPPPTKPGDGHNQQPTALWQGSQSHPQVYSPSSQNLQPHLVQHGNMPQSQHGNVPQSQHGNVPQSQHGNVPRPQHGNVPQSQHGNVPHPQHGNVSQTSQNGNVPQPQHGNMPLSQHGNVPQTQHGNVSQPQHGNVPHPQHWNVPQTSQNGNVSRPQHGNVPQTQPGNVPQSMPQSQHGNVLRPQPGNVPQSQHGNVPQSQHRNVPRAHPGNMPHPQHGNIPQPQHRTMGQYGNLPQIQHGNVPQSQYGNAPQAQYGNVPQIQRGNVPISQYGNMPQMHYPLNTNASINK